MTLYALTDQNSYGYFEIFILAVEVVCKVFIGYFEISWCACMPRLTPPPAARPGGGVVTIKYSASTD